MRSELNGIIWEKFQRCETPTTRVPDKIQSENFETGHLFSIAKLNFESICFLAFFDLRPFKLVPRQLKLAKMYYTLLWDRCGINWKKCGIIPQKLCGIIPHIFCSIFYSDLKKRKWISIFIVWWFDCSTHQLVTDSVES